MRLIKTTEMRGEPHSTTGLFRLLADKLKTKALVPVGVQCTPCREEDSYEIKTTGLMAVGELNYEKDGICLSMSLRVFAESSLSGKDVLYPMGTFRSGSDSKQEMQRMSQLLGDFLTMFRNYTTKHETDFKWEGYELLGLQEDGSVGLGYSCDDIEEMESRKAALVEEYVMVIVYDYGRRQASLYEK